jgi:diguanylate cyclase (GGDEF)-like protein
MTTSRNQHGVDHRTYLGDTIVEELRTGQLPLEPRQFEFWFAYKSARNAGLNAAADAIRARNGTLSGEDIAQLHDTYLSPYRVGTTPDDAIVRMSGRLQELAGSIEDALGTAQLQRESLAAETAELSANAALTLQDVLTAIDRLTQTTRESQARFALLEARMDAMSRDVSVIKQQLGAVRTECQSDPATGLPNRSVFDTTLGATLTEAAETRQPLSLILCNIDYFASFNENFGNFVGDQVLRSVCLLFKAQLRPGDTPTRFAGDSFAAILPRMPAKEAVACAERFRQLLMKQQFIPGVNGSGRLTVSIGVADAIKGDTSEFLLRRAINGLKTAKREGRNRVVEMTPDGPIWSPERKA